jgi:hypothetical protein
MMPFRKIPENYSLFPEKKIKSGYGDHIDWNHCSVGARKW